MPSTSSQWVVWALGSALFAALTVIFSKIGLHTLHADLAIFLRTLAVTVMLGVFLIVQRESFSLADISAKSSLFLLLSALATGASWVCFFRALKMGEAARVLSVDLLSVVLVALLAMLFLGEKLTILHSLGIGLISAGAFLVAW